MNHNLITGIGSGLGRFLYEEIGGIGLTRDNFYKISKSSYDFIIHSAFNTSRNYLGNQLADYIEDCLFLTRELVHIPHKYFIYVSSAAVYPPDEKVWKEDLVIDPDKVKGVYGMCKLMSESLVQKRAKKFLILRPTAMLGKYSRLNSLIRIITNQKTSLTLSADSTFNYVLHKDIGDFIRHAIEKRPTGIYNFAANNSITLEQATKIIEGKLGKRNIQYGTYRFKTNTIDTEKLSRISAFQKKSSENIVLEFVESLKD